MWRNAFDTQPDIDLPGLPRRNVRPSRALAGSAGRADGVIDGKGGQIGGVMRASTCAAWLSAALALGFAVSGMSVDGAFALEEDKAEKARLETCEKDLCGILVKRDAAGSDFSCALQKTWAGSKIKEGVEQKKLKWGFGDVRCSLDLTAKRQEIVDALTKSEYELKLGSHTVRCDVERETEVMKISVALAPK